jgi:hypothetical protein
VDIFVAFNVKPSQNAQSSSAEHQRQRARPSADFMVVHQQAPRHPKADSVVLKLKPSMAMKRAKRDPIGLRLCADSVRLKT